MINTPEQLELLFKAIRDACFNDKINMAKHLKELAETCDCELDTVIMEVTPKLKTKPKEKEIIDEALKEQSTNRDKCIQLLQSGREYTWGQLVVLVSDATIVDDVVSKMARDGGIENLNHTGYGPAVWRKKQT